MTHEFDQKLPFTIRIRAHNLFALSKENWLDDEIVDLVLEYFRFRYADQDGTHSLYIPPTILAHWTQNMNTIDPHHFWGKEAFITRRVKRTFAVVHLQDRWGALCIDFEEKRVYFGDSFKRSLPSSQRKAITKWLVLLGVDLSTWDPVVRLFDVPYQERGSGSCGGIVATNAIEHLLNPNVPLWSQETSECHRLRLLQLVTGYSVLEDSPRCLSINGVHSPIYQKPTVLLKDVEGRSSQLYAVHELESLKRQVQENNAEKEYRAYMRQQEKKERFRSKSFRKDWMLTQDALAAWKAAAVQVYAERQRCGSAEQEKTNALDIRDDIKDDIKDDIEGNFGYDIESLDDDENGILEASQRKAPGLDMANLNATLSGVDRLRSKGAVETSTLESKNHDSVEGDDWVPTVGYEFENFESAMTMLRQWSRLRGFEVVVGHCKKLKGLAEKKTIQCSCAGNPRAKRSKNGSSLQTDRDSNNESSQDHPGPIKEEAKSEITKEVLSQRCGCKVRLNLKFPEGTGRPCTIIHFSDAEHCHPMRPDVAFFSMRARRLSPKVNELIKRYSSTGYVKPDLRKFLSSALDNQAVEEYGDITSQDVRHEQTAQRSRSESDELLAILKERQRTEDGWYVASSVDEINSLKSVFWMSPQQQRLYHRYSDVIVTNNTGQTNRANMPLLTIVVVDCNFKTRIVAAALLSSETKTRYQWALEQLLEATKDQYGKAQPPAVVMCNNDLGLNLALRTHLKSSAVVTCIRHAYTIDIRRRLLQVVGKKKFGSFMARFWEVHKSLTRLEFKKRWLKLLQDYGRTLSTRRYLERLQRRCEFWAQYRVKSLNTAGMQSAQRLEKDHDLVKQKSLGPMTPLLGVFLAVDEKVKEEDFAQRMELDRSLKQMPSAHQWQSVVPHFKGVIEENLIFLSWRIQEHLLDEMKASLAYSFSVVTTNGGVEGTLGSGFLIETRQSVYGWTGALPSDLEDVDGINCCRDNVSAPGSDTDSTFDPFSDNDLDIQGDYNCDSAIDDEIYQRCGIIFDRLSIMDEEEKDEHLAGDEEERSSLEEVKAVSKEALSYWLYKIGIDKVKALHQVQSEIPPRRTQYVALLDNGWHRCTCRLHESKGIICGHFFRLMRASREHKYHIGLIHRRWFTESKQDEAGLVDLIQERLAITAEMDTSTPATKPKGSPEASPVLGMSISESSLPQVNPILSRKRRYAEISSLTETLISMAAESEEMFEHIKFAGSSVEVPADFKNHTPAQVAEDLLESRDVNNDPIFVQTKGRKKEKRLIVTEEVQRRTFLRKKIIPPSSASARSYGHRSRKTNHQKVCGSCGSEGHNKRTCQERH